MTPQRESGSMKRNPGTAPLQSLSMRSTGLLDSSQGLGRHDHLCWGFDDQAAFRAEANRFIADGLALGQRVVYTAPCSVDELHDHLSGITDLDRLVSDGAIELLPIDQTYAARHQGGDQADAYAAATGEALAAGYTGLRAVADATVLALDPTDRDEFVRYEHRIDQRMAGGLPFSALCGYDRTRLDHLAIDELACVHPAVHGGGHSFRVHASPEGGLQLAGEIDAWHHEQVRQAFDRVLASTRPSPVAVDCSALDFVHHRGLLAMDRAARLHAATLELRHVPLVVGRVCEILGLRALTTAPPDPPSPNTAS